MRQALEQLLAPHGQSHLLRFWDELSPAEQAALAEQIRAVDFAELSRLLKRDDAATDWGALARRAEPPPAFRLDGRGNRFTAAEARARGEEALARGELGAILVAGGQGTRLGWPHPKGTFPLGPVSKATLFQILLEKLVALGRRWRVRVPLYLMTSPATHAETDEYLEQNNRFGLPTGDLLIVCQGQMPAVDFATGRVLLEDRGRLALSPDGHGGVLAALARGGALADMARRGLTQLFYFQVDNPLVPIGEPEFLGYHLLSGSEMSTQVVAKRHPRERVGNVVSIDGRVQIIEYSDLPDDAAELPAADGSPRFWAGNTAVHLLDRAFLERVGHDPAGLPFHIARKKVPYINVDGNPPGQRIEPAAKDPPNAVKFERFVFDLLPQAKSAIVMEVSAAEAFAPVKNGPGEASDTAETAQAAMIAQYTRWLRSAGAEVAAGVPVEISPLFALTADELPRKIPPELQVAQPRYFR